MCRSAAVAAAVAALLVVESGWAFVGSPSLRHSARTSAFGSPCHQLPAYRLARPPRTSTITMGIPKLFRWLTDQYPSVNQRISEGLSKDQQEIDNLYLDMNGIIHMVSTARPLDDGDGRRAIDNGVLIRIPWAMPPPSPHLPPPITPPPPPTTTNQPTYLPSLTTACTTTAD